MQALLGFRCYSVAVRSHFEDFLHGAQVPNETCCTRYTHSNIFFALESKIETSTKEVETSYIVLLCLHPSKVLRKILDRDGFTACQHHTAEKL